MSQYLARCEEQKSSNSAAALKEFVADTSCVHFLLSVE